MLYAEEHVKANIRNRDGKRVFYLADGDTLTPSARDFLSRERIEILPASSARPEEYVLESGGILREKPEHYTHLRGNILVPKTHPVIAFRGAMDFLQAHLLLTQQLSGESLRKDLQEILDLARNVLRWDVMQEPAKLDRLCGLTQAQMRQRSHHPEQYYGTPHFMPQYTDTALLLQLNLCRCAARQAELAAAHAFGQARGDLIQVLNRMSSMLYLLMLREKTQR